MMTFIIITVAVIVTACVISHIYQGRELSTTEIENISIQLRMDSIWERIAWSTNQINPSFLRAQKKQMKSSGGIHSCDENSSSFPAYAAALLKGKKHEWFIVGWSTNKKVRKYWCNKGPNRMMVIPGIKPEEIHKIAKEIGCDVVIDVHNHPNPMPSRLNCTIASDADLKHSKSTGIYLSSNQIAYVAFVAERGTVNPYAIFIPQTWSPLSKKREQTIQIAESGPSSRRRLRQRHIHSAPYRHLKISRFVHNIDEI